MPGLWWHCFCMRHVCGLLRFFFFFFPWLLVLVEIRSFPFFIIYKMQVPSISALNFVFSFYWDFPWNVYSVSFFLPFYPHFECMLPSAIFFPWIAPKFVCSFMSAVLIFSIDGFRKTGHYSVSGSRFLAVNLLY